MKKIISLAPFFIILAAVLWAVDLIVFRPELYTLPVALVVFTEHVLATILMIPLVWRELPKLRVVSRRQWLAFLLVALFGGVLGTMFITKALFYVNFTNLSIVALIQKLQPVFALTLAAVLLKERLPRRFFFWSAAAIVATYFVTFGFGLPVINGENKTAWAALFALGAAFAWGSSTVFSKDALRSVSYRLATFIRFFLTSIIMTGVVLYFGEFGAFGNISQRQWTTFLLIVLTSGAGAMFLYYYGLKRVSASVSTICELAFPLTAILLEYILRGQVLNISQWIGAVVLLVAIYRVSQMNNTVKNELNGKDQLR